MDNAFRRAVAEARRHGDLYFAGLLSEDRIMEAFGAAGQKKWSTEKGQKKGSDRKRKTEKGVRTIFEKSF